MADTSTTLAPCPFCGGAPHLQPSSRGDYTSIVCPAACGGPLVIVIPNDRIDEGIDAWNRRAPAPASSEPVAVPAEMEPVATARFCLKGWRDLVVALTDLPDGTDLYTAAQVQAMLAQGLARVPLSREQVQALIEAEGNAPEHRTMYDFARAIERAQGITGEPL